MVLTVVLTAADVQKARHVRDLVTFDVAQDNQFVPDPALAVGRVRRWFQGGDGLQKQAPQLWSAAGSARSATHRPRVTVESDDVVDIAERGTQQPVLVSPVRLHRDTVGHPTSPARARLA